MKKIIKKKIAKKPKPSMRSAIAEASKASSLAERFRLFMESKPLDFDDIGAEMKAWEDEKNEIYACIVELESKVQKEKE